MDIVIIILCVLLVLGGFIFSILPPIPGPVLPLGGLYLLHYGHSAHFFSMRFLLIMTVVTILVMIVENVVPIWGTKKMGGSRAGIYGSTIGLFLGLFFLTPFFLFAGPFAPILSIIAGTFLGAVAGELFDGRDLRIAIRSGMGSFFGFLLGTGLKLLLCGVMMYQMGDVLL